MDFEIESSWKSYLQTGDMVTAIIYSGVKEGVKILEILYFASPSMAATSWYWTALLRV